MTDERRLVAVARALPGLEVTLRVEDPRRPGMALGLRGTVIGWAAHPEPSVLLGGLGFADDGAWIDLRDVERVEIEGGLREARDADAHRAAWREGQERAESAAAWRGIKPPLGRVPYLPTHNHPRQITCDTGCPFFDWAEHKRRHGDPYAD